MPGSVIGFGVSLEGEDNLSGPAGRSAAAFSQMTATMGSTLDMMGNVSMAAGAVGTAIGGLGAIQVQKAIGAFTKLNATMTGIRRIGGLTKETTDELQQSFLELSSDLPLSAQELAEVGTVAARTGVQSTQAMEDLAFSAAQFARASDMAEAEAAESMVRMQAMFDLTSEEMEKTTDVMVKLANTTTATASYINQFTLRAGGMAKQFGMTQAQIAAIGSSLKDMGIKARTGGTNFTKFLTIMAEKSSAFAKQMGMQEESYKKALDTEPMEMMLQFFEQLDGTGTEMTDMMKKLGISGMRTQQVVLGLANNLDGLEGSIRNAEQAFESGGTVEQNFQTQTESLSAAFDTLTGSIGNIYISFGRFLEPAVQAVLGVLIKLSSWFLNLQESTQNLVFMVFTVASGLTLVSGIGLLVAGVFMKLGGALVTMLSPLGTAVVSFNAMSLAQIQSLAVGWAQTTMLKAQTAWYHASAAAMKLYSLATGIATGATSALAAALATLGWPQIIIAVTAIVGLMGLFIGKSDRLTGVLGGLATMVGDVLTPIFTTLGVVVSAAIDIIAGGFSLLMTSIRMVLLPVRLVMTAVQTLFGLVFDLVGGVVKAFGAVVGVIMYAVESIVWFISELGVFIETVLGGVLELALYPLIEAVGWLVDIITVVAGVIIAPFAALFGVLRGVAQFIMDTLYVAFNLLMEVGGLIMDVLLFPLRALMWPIQQIASLFTSAGESGGGFINGIADAVSGLLGVILAPFRWLTSALKAVRSVLQNVGEAFRWAFSIVGTILSPIVDFFSWILQPMKTWENMMFSLGRVVGKQFAPIILDLQAAWNDLTSAFMEAVQPIIDAWNSLFGEAETGVTVIDKIGSILGSVLGGVVKVILKPIEWALKGIILVLQGLIPVVQVLGVVFEYTLVPVINFIGVIIGLFRGLFGMILAIPIAYLSGVVAVLSKIVDGVMWLLGVWWDLQTAILGGAVSIAGSLLGWLFSPLTSVVDVIQVLFGAWWGLQTAFLGGLISIGSTIIDYMLAPFRLIGDFIWNVIVFQLKMIYETAMMIATPFMWIADLISGGVSEAISSVVGGLQSVVDFVTGGFLSLMNPLNWFSGGGEDGGGLLSSILGGAMSGISGMIGGMFSGLGSIVGDAFSGITDMIIAPFKAAIDGVMGIITAPVDLFKNAISGIGGMIKTVFSWTPLGMLMDKLGAVGNMAKQVFQGIGSVINSVVDNIIKLGKWIMDIMGRALSAVMDVMSPMGGLMDAASSVAGWFGFGGDDAEGEAGTTEEGGSDAEVAAKRNGEVAEEKEAGAPQQAAVAVPEQIVIPVNVSIGDKTLKELVVEISEDELRSQFGEDDYSLRGVDI